MYYQKKAMKKIFISLLCTVVIICLLSFAILDIYTEQKKQALLNKIVENYEPFQYKFVVNEKTKKDTLITFGEIQPIQLFDLLYSNIHIQKPNNIQDDAWYAGSLTSNEYKKGWRNIIVKEPNLLFDAWNFFGESALLNLNSKLGYYVNQKLIDNKKNKFQNNNFNTSKFWKIQKNHIRKYILLCDELLKLNDKKLNYFIKNTDMYDNSLCFDFNVWLASKGILEEYSQDIYVPRSNNCYKFPGDLILLTKRINSDFPEWGVRKFLLECKKFSTLVLTTAEETYP